MKKGVKIGLITAATMLLLAGCSDSVEFGPVPTITPRPMPTSAPVVTQPVEKTEEEEKTLTLAEQKKFKEQYTQTGELPKLYEQYKEYFSMGVMVSKEELEDEKRQALVKEQFNVVSCRSELSPANIMDYEATKASKDLSKAVLDFSGADAILSFAQKNGLAVRGPVLISHGTPSWFFTKSFSEDEVTIVTDDAGTETETVEYASEEVILTRMENYIKEVITYCNTNYPDLVVSWDVLSDAINATENAEKQYRVSSHWYQSLGEAYFLKSFEFAAKYATEKQTLFYCEDLMWERTTREAAQTLINLLKEGGNITGVASLSHYNTRTPNVFSIEDMFKMLQGTGLEIHMSNFYVDTLTSSLEDYDTTTEEFLESSVKRYKNLMTALIKSETSGKSDVTMIEFESLSDDVSSLNQPKEYTDHITGEVMFGVDILSYPVLFDENLQPKDAYFGAVLDADIK